MVADLLHIAGDQEVPGLGQTIEGIVADAADLGTHADSVNLIPVLIPGSVAGILIVRHGFVQNAVFDLQRAVFVQVPQQTACQAKGDRLQLISRGRRGVRVRGLIGDVRFGIRIRDRGDNASVFCRLDGAFSAFRLFRQGKGSGGEAQDHQQGQDKAQCAFDGFHDGSSIKNNCVRLNHFDGEARDFDKQARFCAVEQKEKIITMLAQYIYTTPD